MSKSSKGKTPVKAAEKSPRLRPLLVAVVVSAVLGATLWAGVRSARPAYKRFVSRPLPDGTRYTFLYPAHLKVIEELAESKPLPGEMFASHTVHIGTEDARFSTWDKVRRRLGFSVPPPAEWLHVATYPLNPDNIKNDRQQERWIADGERRQSVYVWDKRTRSLFWFLHCCPQSEARQFNEHAPIVADSFAVLPPGVPVPSP